jgi:hypothetical protein
MHAEPNLESPHETARHTPARVRAWPRYLRRREVPQYLDEEWGVPCAYTSLMRMASVGGGPLFRHFGRVVVCAPEDLDTWAEAKLSRPKRSTSDTTPNDIEVNDTTAE